MSQVEKILHQGLESDPSDWSVRLELASKLLERSAITEVSEVLRGAPTDVPIEETTMHRIVEISNETKDLETLKVLIRRFVAENPVSAWGQSVAAQVSFHTGSPERAREYYDAAVSLDYDLADPDFEAQLPPPATFTQRQRLAKSDSRAVVPAKLVSPEAHADDEESVATAVLVDDDDEELLEVEEASTYSGKSLIVADGEAVKGADKAPDQSSKISALTVAILVHIAIFAIAGLVTVATARRKPPQIVASSLVNLDEETIEKVVMKKPQQRAAASSAASAQMNITSVNAVSSVSLPSFDVEVATFDPIGLTGDLGMSMSFEGADGGGMVAFFGSKSASKKVVFVVDYSGSMNGDKDKLMRSELTKSVAALPPGVEYQLIFFSGPAWFAGQEENGKGEETKEGTLREVRDGGKKYKWYAGWDEDARGSDERILYHYEDGEDKLPTEKYIKATKSNIRKSLKHIEETKLTLGTDWRWPLRMAMNMEPDTIYFMTDGAFGTKGGVSKEEMIDELLSYNRRHGKAKINTICMMVLNARAQLEQLADGTGGEFTLVLEDGTPVRGRDLDKR